jgi:hypothetical protein
MLRAVGPEECQVIFQNTSPIHPTDKAQLRKSPVSGYYPAKGVNKTLIPLNQLKKIL